MPKLWKKREGLVSREIRHDYLIKEREKTIRVEKRKLSSELRVIGKISKSAKSGG